MTEQPKEIPFSCNWNNKLNCDAFTEIRPRNDKKFILNHDYTIIIKHEPIYIAKLIFIKHFKLDTITLPMAILDTGYDIKETISIFEKMYKKYNINVHEIEWSWMIFYHKSIMNHLPSQNTSESSCTSY